MTYCGNKNMLYYFLYNIRTDIKKKIYKSEVKNNNNNAVCPYQSWSWTN
jgi:hypothetical protein